MAKAVYYEAGRTLVPMAQLTDSGDHKTFLGLHDLWSDYAGYSPNVLPNALISGGTISPTSGGVNDEIDVIASYCNLNGVARTGTNPVAGTTALDVIRDVTDPYLISSVTISSTGAIVVIPGTADASAFSETIGASGGPPYVPVDSILIGQVRTTSITAAPILASEIFQIPGSTMELLGSYTIKYSNVTNRIAGYAGIEFPAAQPLIHTGDTPAAVYAEYYTPVFGELTGTRNFTEPALSATVTSETFYDRTVGSTSETIGAGSVEYLAQPDGISDPFMGEIGQTMWFKFKYDSLSTPYIITLAAAYPSGSYPADASTVFTVNLIAEDAAERVVS